MGTRGPAKTPAKIQELRGNPGKRPLPEDVPFSAEPFDPPDWLDDEALDEWDRVYGELIKLDKAFLKRVDRAALSAYCNEWARYVECQRIMREEGRTYTTGTGYVRPRPEVKLAHEHLRHAQAYAREFGFTPSARARIDFGLVDSGQEQSDLLEMIGFGA